MRKFLAAVLLCMGLAILQAHDMWLEGSDFFVLQGKKATIRLGNGTIFAKSENAVAPERLTVFQIMEPSGQVRRATGVKTSGEWTVCDLNPKGAGNYWVAAATRPSTLKQKASDFEEYLEHDGLPDAIEERKRLGISKRDETEQYSKYVKTYLQVGNDSSDNFGKPLGLEIEIIPQENPYRLQGAGKLPFLVNFQGKPLANLLLHAGVAGGAAQEQSVRTDNKGQAVLEVNAKGRWYIKGIHLLQVDKADHSYESYWTSLTFEVR